MGLGSRYFRTRISTLGVIRITNRIRAEYIFGQTGIYIMECERTGLRVVQEYIKICRDSRFLRGSGLMGKFRAWESTSRRIRISIRDSI